MTPRWADPRYPHLAFIPVEPRFDRPPLDILRCVGTEFPVICTGYKWVVEPKLVELWRNLENNLRLIGDTLHKPPAPFSSLFEETFPLPSSFGYGRQHKSRRGAQISARISRDAFLPLIAWCSYNLAFHNYVVKDTNGVLAWEFILLRQGILPASVHELATSEIVDFSPEYRRVGVFVDQTCVHKVTIRSIYRLPINVPVWIAWGSNPQEGHMPEFKNVCPLSHEIVEAQTAASQSISNEWQSNEDDGWHTLNQPLAPSWPSAPSTSTLVWHTVSSTSSPPLPSANSNNQAIPDPVTRQIPGESWQEYFTRMESRYARRIRQESDRVMQARLSREAAQDSHPYPGQRSGPTSFHWRHDETGVWVREHISRGLARTIWANYSNSQRIYNSVDDEWDICTEFDPQGAGPEVLDSLSDDEVNMPQSDAGDPSPPSPYPPRSPPPPIPDAWQHDTSSEIPPATPLPLYGTLLDTLYSRYGFLSPCASTDVPSDFQMTLNKAKFIFGDNVTTDPTLMSPYIVQFAHCMTSNSDIPEHLWDLAQDSESPFTDNVNPRFQLIQHVLNDEVYFFMEERQYGDSARMWQLVLKDPVTVLECFRRDDASILQLTAFLLWTGHPFSTKLHRNQISLPPNYYPKPPVTLGWRPQSLKPVATEYILYENLRNHFLQLPKGRAALLKGGIIWRLALEALGARSEDIVIEGPSAQLNYEQFLSGESGQWFDDTLSQVEMDLICGVYRIATSKFFVLLYIK